MDNTSVYEKCKAFLKKYPKTINWRLKKHAEVVQQHINDDEVVLFSFAGQMGASIIQPFYTTIVVFTNKRMLLGRSMFFGRTYYSSKTPDMLNDFEIMTDLLYGAVVMDTIKEHVVIGCLDKRSLIAVEDALSKYMINEKLKYLKKDS